MKSSIKNFCLLILVTISTTSFSQQEHSKSALSKNEGFSISGRVACITPSKLSRDPNRDASQYSQDELSKHLNKVNSVLKTAAKDLDLGYVLQDVPLCNPELNISDYIVSIVNGNGSPSVANNFKRPIKVVYVNASKLTADTPSEDQKKSRLIVANQILVKMFSEFKIDLVLSSVVYAAKENNITDYLLATIKQEKANPPKVLIDPPKKIRIGYMNSQRLFKTHPGYEDLASRTDKSSREEVEKIIYRANQRLITVAEEGNFDFILQDVVWTKRDFDVSSEVIGQF